MEHQRAASSEAGVAAAVAGDYVDTPVPEGPASLPAAVEDVPVAAGLLPIGLRDRRAATPDLLAADPIAYELGGEPLVPETRIDDARRALMFAGRVGVPVTVRDYQPSRMPPEVIVRKRAANPPVVLPQATPARRFEPAIAVAAGLTAPARLVPVESRVKSRLASPEPRRDLRAWLPLAAPEAESPAALFNQPPFGRLARLTPNVVAPFLAPRTGETGAMDLAGEAVRLPIGDPAADPAKVRQSALPLAGRLEMVRNRPEPANCFVRPEPPRPANSFTGRAGLPSWASAAADIARLRLAGAVLPAVSRVVERPRESGGAEIGLASATAKPVMRPIVAATEERELGWAVQQQLPLASAVKCRKSAGLARRGTHTPEAFASKPAMPWMRRVPQPIEFSDISAAAAETRARRWPALSLSSLRQASVSVRLMVMAVPVVLFVALRPPSEPPVPGSVKAPAASFVNARMEAVRAAIQSRAGVELLDDFRAGLDNWVGRSDLTASWSYDQTGFVRPGPLALFRPSMGMADYDLEFLGQIEQRAMGWVFRAEDMRNYHVAKIVVLRGGPLPSIGLERYTVRNGKEGPHTVAPLPLNVRGDTVYRVRLEVRGPDFSLYVQNQMVQFWSDRRFAAGGIGFFSGRGEQSRIRWVQLSHQYDTIGRLCAYIAPMAVVTYSLQPAMGAATK